MHTYVVRYKEIEIRETLIRAASLKDCLHQVAQDLMQAKTPLHSELVGKQFEIDTINDGGIDDDSLSIQPSKTSRQSRRTRETKMAEPFKVSKKPQDLQSEV